MDIVLVETPEQIDQLKALFTEYFDWINDELGIDMSYQGVTEELAGLPGKYAPPEGRLALAYVDGEAAACAALRPLEPGVVELKRMYTRPQYRHMGLARAIAVRLLQEGREAGYQMMRLDTAKFLHPAIKLYESLGFQYCQAYYHVPEDVLHWTVFMELPLGEG